MMMFFSSNLILSSDIFLNLIKILSQDLKLFKKFILLSDNIINEDSKAITFNYQNQFSDSRFYGTDLEDNSSRIIYGLENKIKIL